MLDPHIRTSLSPVAAQPGKYETTLRIPDRHGVFKFVVDYRRKGLVFISLFWFIKPAVLITYPSGGHICIPLSPPRLYLRDTTNILVSCQPPGHTT